MYDSVWTLLRLSSSNRPPLIYRLLISEANSSMNGTVVMCTDLETRNSSSADIRVITDQMMLGKLN